MPIFEVINTRIQNKNFIVFEQKMRVKKKLKKS